MLQRLLRMWPQLRPSHAAKLAGVNGFTGRGTVGFSESKSGVKLLTVKLDGLAGREAEILADAKSAFLIKINNGHADRVFTSNQGDGVPDLKEGHRIDVRQNGDVILSGILTRR